MTTWNYNICNSRREITFTELKDPIIPLRNIKEGKLMSEEA